MRTFATYVETPCLAERASQVWPSSTVAQRTQSPAKAPEAQSASYIEVQALATRTANEKGRHDGGCGKGLGEHGCGCCWLLQRTWGKKRDWDASGGDDGGRREQGGRKK